MNANPHPTESVEDASAEIQAALQEIDLRYRNKTYWQRLKTLFGGLRADPGSREYKEAQIEAQRFAAPALAILIPLVLVVAATLLTGMPDDSENVMVTEIQEVQEVQEIDDEPPEQDKIPDLELLPEILSEIPAIDVPVDAPMLSDAPITAQPAAIDAVQMIRSPVVLKGIYGSRTSSGFRGNALNTYGGDARTEEAVMRALRWLKMKQNPNGSWSGGATGFALLAFLAHGERPSTESSPEFGETVRKAIDNLCGRVGRHMNAFEVYALSEAYGMTMNPQVGAAAKKALERHISMQNDKGQWLEGNVPDLLGMCFTALALKGAKMAGLQVEGIDEALKREVDGFLAQGNATHGSFRSHAAGPFGATPPRDKIWHSMIGVFGMQYLGAGDMPIVRKTLDMLDKVWPPATLGRTAIACCPVRSNYFSTMVYFNEGGNRWRTWNTAMKKVYCDGQTVETGVYRDHNGIEQEVGYWKCEDEHIGEQPMMSTCYIAQQLMIYYRFLPSTTEKAWEIKTTSDDLTATDSSDIIVDSGDL